MDWRLTKWNDFKDDGWFDYSVIIMEKRR